LWKFATEPSIVPGIDRRTLARWRARWLSTFTDGPFALIAKATFMPAVDIASRHLSQGRVAGSGANGWQSFRQMSYTNAAPFCGRRRGPAQPAGAQRRAG
jgi:hypothetical protein